jgi:hypothetical protein
VPETIKLKVGRVSPGADLTTDTNITIVGESAQQTPTGTGLNTFPTRIPVQAGDDIGIYVNALAGVVHSCDPDGSYTDHFFGGDPTPGTTELFTEENFHHDVSATLEPDCNHNGLGDETQDPDTSSCHSNAFTFAGVTRNKKNGTATLKVNVPESGELVGSGNGAKVAAAGATISKAVTPGTAQLLIKAKGKKKRKLNETGKVKLSVAVTYTPTGGKPNTQSIKVKLKKKL